MPGRAAVDTALTVLHMAVADTDCLETAVQAALDMVVVPDRFDQGRTVVQDRLAAGDMARRMGIAAGILVVGTPACTAVH